MIDDLKRMDSTPPSPNPLRQPRRFASHGDVATPRYQAAGSDTVIDSATQLMWARAGIEGTFDWQQAHAVVAALRLGGHDDWRVPTIRELLGLVEWTEHDPAIDREHFAAVSSWYWSASDCAGSDECAWFVDFGHGVADFHPKHSRAHVRAVRDLA